MTNIEPVGITVARLDRIPRPWNEAFSPTDLPLRTPILEKIYLNELPKAKQHKNFIGLTDEQLELQVPALVDACLAEMLEYETLARESAQKRLAKLKEIAPSVTRVIDRSAPGDYYHLNKTDKYQFDPAMQGGDRLRSDQAAILAVVLAGIKQGWEDKDLLLFLNQHVLLNDNEELNALREKAKRAIKDSGIRIAYSGEAHEIDPIRTVLNQKNVFIPKDCVDFVGPEGIKDTYTQAEKFREYLQANLKSGDSFIEPINLQGIRASRMAGAVGMIPEGTSYYIYAMPTVKGERSQEYRDREIKGTVFYALIAKASFDPTPHKII